MCRCQLSLPACFARGSGVSGCRKHARSWNEKCRSRRRSVRKLFLVILQKSLTVSPLTAFSENASDSILLSTVCGSVEQVNRLTSVRALRTRYQGEVGDVVVGRVTEVASRRWRIDINSRQDAVLHLSSITLPGGALVIFFVHFKGNTIEIRLFLCSGGARMKMLFR